MSSATSLRFDAFLSYNSQDRPAVEEVARRLRAEGLTPYLEVDELAPGREFQIRLAEALRDSKTCVVFLGPSGLGPWQNEELQVAIDRRVRNQDFHVIPVLLPGSERPRRGDVAHLEFLINASWVEFLKTLDNAREFRRLVWGITGKKPAAEVEPRYEGVCPYRGLEAFGPGDAAFFFGRENLTDWLVSDLRREVRAAARGVRFLAVLGPSGSGKSSLVLAGLIPRLQAGAIDGSERWKVAIVRRATTRSRAWQWRWSRGSSPRGPRPMRTRSRSWPRASMPMRKDWTAIPGSRCAMRPTTCGWSWSWTSSRRSSPTGPRMNRRRRGSSMAGRRSSPTSCTRRPGREAGWRSS